MSTETNNHVLSMKFPPEVKKKIVEIAEKEIRSINNTINMLVIKGIESIEQSQ